MVIQVKYQSCQMKVTYHDDCSKIQKVRKTLSIDNLSCIWQVSS